MMSQAGLPPPFTYSGLEEPAVTPTPADYYLWGNEYRRRGDQEAAEHALRDALARDPGLFDARLSLAFLYRDQGRMEEAARLFDVWLKSRPSDALLCGQVARFLETLGDSGRALACLDSAIQADPNLVQAWFERGRLLLALGQFEEAARSLVRTLELDPDHDAAHLLIVQTRRFGPDDPLTAFLEAQAARPQVSASTQACRHFALGKVYDDLGQWERALTEIEEANRIRRSMTRFPKADRKAELDLRLALPPGAWAPEADSPAEPLPLFIVGLPRAGTTLLESLLLTHPALSSAGELDTLGQLVDGCRLLERWRAALDAASVPDGLADMEREVTECYGAALTRYRRRECRYVIDKNPLNFWHAGAIRKLLPGARILSVERDPRDVLVSLYFQNFDHPALDFSYSIEDILFYLRAHDLLMAYWKRCLGTSLRTVRYETLVGEPVTVVDELLSWLGLPAAGPHTGPPAERVIRTASAFQARQPVYSHSVGRWKPYARMLREHHPELASFGFDDESA